MLATLQQNIPMLLASFERITLLYVVVYGAGNVRVATDPQRLSATVGGQLQDGLPQAAADGVRQYYWEGDLYAIADANTAIVWEAPQYQYNIKRGSRGRSPIEDVTMEGEIEGNLSTYR